MIEKNIWKYLIGQPCLIYEFQGDTNPVYSTIEGYDNVADLVISERTTYKPYQIKPLLKTVKDITEKDIKVISSIVFGDISVESFIYDDSIVISAPVESLVIKYDFGYNLFSYDTKQKTILNGLKLNQWFFDNGFDVFDLIEIGLAKHLNINGK